MRAIAGVLIVAAMSLGVTSSSQAQVNPRRTPGALMDAAKQACETAIDNRMSRLHTLRVFNTDSTHETSAHKTRLDDQLAAAEQGLSDLRAKIDGDTDPTTLRSDCRAIADDYRVYDLVSPKVREVLVADWETDIATRLDAIATKIQNAINAAKSKGKDTTTAQSDLDQMKTQIANAKAAISGVASSVIDLKVSDWPGAHATMMTGRQSLRTGRDDLRGARNDGWNVVRALKS